MSGPETNVRVLDSAYKPSPPFSEWASHTSVDTTRWDRYKAEIEARPEQTSAALKRAREVVKRAAAIDTGAIEGLYEVDRGFTFTIAFEAAAWELELAKKGENVRSLFEAQLHAYDYVLDLATNAEPITEAAIRKLHEVVCAAQAYRVITAIGPQEQELVKGPYKVLPNHVRTRDGVDHSYAPVDVTPAEMARLVAEMRTDAFLAAHPVFQAAYAHYGLVVIHPFADGNGRVARALASAFTYRAILMPIMILSEHKSSYLDSLEAADLGGYQTFVDFMLGRVLDTMLLVDESFRSTLAPTAEESAAALNSLYVTKGGYTQGQVDESGNQLLQIISAEISALAAAKSTLNLRGSANVATMQPPAQFEPDSAYRLPARSDHDWSILHVEFSTAPPAQAKVFRNFVLWLPRDAVSDDDLQLVLVQVGVRSYTKQSYFSARINELIPAISGVLRVRIGLLAERIVGEILTELRREAETQLRAKSRAPGIS